MVPRAVRTLGLGFTLVVLVLFSLAFWEGGSAVPGVHFVGTWGQAGTEPGGFQDPFDVALDAEGFVYVTDSGNHRVQKFTRDGAFVLQWGSAGTEPGHFKKPAGIAIAENAVYVSDYFADTVQQFTHNGKFLTRWGQSGSQPGELDSPAGIAVGPDGSIYVTDDYNFRVQRFTPDGRVLKVWGQKGKVNSVISALNVLLPEDLEGSFYYPARLTVGPDHRIYVADSYNNRIQVFTEEGKFVRKWGGMGLRGGRFRVASGLAFDRGGRLYIADFYNNRVQVFSPDGDYLGQLGASPNNPDMDGPTSVAVSPDGNIYVVDFHHNRILWFQASG